MNKRSPHMHLRLALIVIINACTFVATYAGERATALRQALENADRIVIEEPPFRGDPIKPIKPFTIIGAAKISDLVNKLDFDDEKSGFYCRCVGDSIITFYKQDKKLAVLSHHHGRSLRWDSGSWKGDALFTQDAALVWRTWFKQNGEMRYENMYLENERIAEKKRKIQAQFIACFPQKVATAFVEAAKKDNDGFITFSPEDKEEKQTPRARELAAAFENPVEMSIAICKALGSLAQNEANTADWFVTTYRESLVLASARTISGKDFVKALEQAKGYSLVGGARLFFAEKLHKKLSPAERSFWAPKLARAVLEQDSPSNYSYALRSSAYYSGKDTTPLLIEIAQGKLGKADRDVSSDELNIRMLASLLLAQTGYDKANQLAKENTQINQLSPADNAALRVIEALSGGKKLDADIFSIDSPAIASAALKHLEKKGDKEALDAIINGGTKHNYAVVREESVLAVERLTGQKWFMNGAEERAEWHAEKIREWWKTNRSSYQKKNAID